MPDWQEAFRMPESGAETFVRGVRYFGKAPEKAQKNRPEAVVSARQGGEADGARTRDLQRDRLAL